MRHAAPAAPPWRDPVDDERIAAVPGDERFYKSIGYTLGPLLGGVLVWAGGLRLLFTVLAALGAAVAVWAALAVPVTPPLPKARQTVLDLARRLADPVFLAPTAALAAATAALSVGVGFLPVSGRAAGLGTIATGAAVSVLAGCAAAVQPRAGRALDDGRLTTRTGLAAGQYGADHSARLRRTGREHSCGASRADHGRRRTGPGTGRRGRPAACRRRRLVRHAHLRLRGARRADRDPGGGRVPAPSPGVVRTPAGDGAVNHRTLSQFWWVRCGRRRPVNTAARTPTAMSAQSR